MRILSGMQPTGLLHLGNYIGALKNWVDIQNDPEKKADLFYFIADLHSLTSNQAGYREETSHYIREMLIDWLSAGIDPEVSTLFLQSDISEHCELYTLLSMITPISWLSRNPTYKEKMDEIEGKELDNLGFLGYPVLQTADIALYKAEAVPVGKDQIPHLEISREIIRRFNQTFGKEVLVEPQPILGPVARLNGLDGRKMSKSYSNTIYLSDDESTLREKVMTMVTDIQRARRNDPGHPGLCNLFPYFQAFCDDAGVIDTIKRDCESAVSGCVDDKKKLADLMLEALAPFRARRAEWSKRPDTVQDILSAGAKKARETARATMEEVRKAIGLSTQVRYGG